MSRGRERAWKGRLSRASGVCRGLCPRAQLGGRRGRLAAGTGSLSAAHSPAGAEGRAQPSGDLNSAPGASTAWLRGLGKPLSSPASVSCPCC